MPLGKEAGVTPERLMELAWGYGPPLIIETAVKTAVFDALDGGAKTVAETSAATGASERGLAALMNALVGLELLAKDEGERYRLTPERATFLVRAKPAYRGDLFGISAPS
jgi:hypothetical protein